MPKAKKFGAFSGVFTPSVLTILGVIMYMRLGWVVGNAGLITALIIIVISHIISVTTGLSISSVATDKKIKTGGIYYILSRSLGFPMGGAIGLALFTGTALGISMYLVGFAESVLAVEQIREFLHLEQDLNSYRIVASASLLLLVIIAFISTSLAIKSQYFIMGAIALSLISIVWGLVSKTEFLPVEIAFSPAREGASIQEIFGVFFPAVTGFTAGVAMSGDLKDPKKNIPVGTLSAIAVGFIVYIALAVMFAFFVDRQLLQDDYNFLLKVAKFSPFVLAGIWGATLSSALGGILGGPRILQAISKDKITPRVFAKGYGASNEPRNALIFIFLIAEGGILLGELNLIAGIVSMFYLASYGFINLAFFLEKWASTDFRPVFKVRGLVGLIGFVACFAVMAQLGIITMFVALIIMFGLFAWLNRKQLKSETGDVWQSVWMSVVRRALHSLDKKNLEERNWQANIILFSGGQGARPHLIEFGKDLVGQYGLLSNFDLHETKDKKYLFPKHLQSHTHESFEGKGIFTRRQSCSDIYSGIETIISTYGFSGIEPNTVIMGWMRQSKNPVRFSQMIQRIYELDVNLLLIDYDKRYGYGDYKTVDIWWRGSGNNGNLALNLMKFLWASENWQDAKLRLLIGNPVNENAVKIKQHAEEVISNMRIDAEIKVINNQIDQKPFYDLIRTESINTDLIILGMPDVQEGREEEFVKNTNDLMHKIGTVVLIKASSQFKNLNLGLRYKLQTREEQQKLSSIINETESTVDLFLPESPTANEKLGSLHDDLSDINTRVIKEQLNTYFSLFDKLSEDILFSAQDLIRRIDFSNEDPEYPLHLRAGLDKFLIKCYALIKKFSNEQIQIQEISLRNSFEMMIHEIDSIVENIPEHFRITYHVNDLRFINGESKRERKFKKKMRARMKTKQDSVDYKVKYKKLINEYLPADYYEITKDIGYKTGALTIELILNIRKYIRKLRNTILLIQSVSEDKRKFTKSFLNEQKKIIADSTDYIIQLKNMMSENIYGILQREKTNIINALSKDLSLADVNKSIKNGHSSKSLIQEKAAIEDIPSLIRRNEDLLFSAWKAEILLIEFENGLYKLTGEAVKSAENYLRKEVLSKLFKVKSHVELIQDSLKQSKSKQFELAEIQFEEEEAIRKQINEFFDGKIEKLKYLKDKFPKKVKLLTNDAYNTITENQFSQLETTDISLSAYIEYVVHTKFNEPLFNFIERFPKEIHETGKKIQNIIRLVSFSMSHSDKNSQSADISLGQADKLKFIENQLDEITKIEEQTIHLIKSVGLTVTERLNDLSNLLNIYSILKEAAKIKRFSDKLSKKKKTNRIKESYRKFIISKDSFLNTLRFSKSIPGNPITEGIESNVVSKINEIHKIREHASVSDEVLKKIPFYYKQLFLKTDNFSNEFFVGREEELSEIEKSVKRYQSGFHGAIFIIGERYSGKSFLTHYSIQKFLPGAPVYKISPAIEGSVSVKNFRTKFAQAFEEKGSYDEKLAKAKKGTVIILDEFEMWWERSIDGFAVVEEFIRLVNDYGNKFLFFVNLNTYSYSLINSLRHLELYALNVIHCNPFDALQLSEAVLMRHNAGGVQMEYAGKNQEKLKQRDYAEMFNAYHSQTGGNIGLSVYTWLADISDVQTGVIIKHKAVKKSTLISSEFEAQTSDILLQFILHKRISLHGLLNLSQLNEENLRNEVFFLLRSGILVEPVKSVYEINKFMYIPVLNLIRKSHLL